jgi:hypothetical protein
MKTTPPKGKNYVFAANLDRGIVLQQGGGWHQSNATAAGLDLSIAETTSTVRPRSQTPRASSTATSTT